MVGYEFDKKNALKQLLLFCNPRTDSESAPEFLVLMDRQFFLYKGKAMESEADNCGEVDRNSTGAAAGRKN